mmetsp:Transcript_57895/g.130534  ORF Transcript_57895/g.130534 Transcript_57895/m.130534 type:complete len:209 (-) Transcript_57895:9-635(-)
MTSRRQCLGEPVEALVEAIACRGASGLDEPLVVPQAMEPKLFRHLCSRHRAWQVLLVCEHEHDRVSQLILREHLSELLTCVINTVMVVAVYDKDDALRAQIVVAPELANLVLATDVPYCEGKGLVFDCFHVEADSGDRRHHLPKLELVEDGCLPSSVQTDHYHLGLRLASDKAAPDPCKGNAHDFQRRPDDARQRAGTDARTARAKTA